MRLLLLGGTGEARDLAARLHPNIELVSSLAGRVPDPALPVGPVRMGGFGGVEGLRNWLVENNITAAVDATHPFASAMTAHAAQACSGLGLRHLVLHRPAWSAVGAHRARSDTAAAEYVAQQGYSRVFLTTGRSGAAAFAGSDAWFLIRVVTAPDPTALPRCHQLLLSRGPYRYEDEYGLLQRYRIDVLVTKNSGGELTEAKLHAAQALDVDVVMIDRPPLPAGVAVVSSVEDAVSWVLSLGAQPG